jgi:hypothetical protein
MADLHEALIRKFRKRNVLRGMRDAKSPMPTYRPDIFVEKVTHDGQVVRQVAVEAEIHTTLFSEHTSHQLLHMDHFIRLQKTKRVRALGFLLVPKGKAVRANAESLLDSLFPEGTTIKIESC